MFKYIKHKALANSDVHKSFHEMAPRIWEILDPSFAPWLFMLYCAYYY